jgi:phytoene synthase
MMNGPEPRGMTPELYCEQRAGGRGSTVHYSLLFVTAAQRRALLAVHAFREETRELASDPVVALRRLAWWTEEIDAAFHARARHPIAQSLTTAITEFHLDREFFDLILAAAANEIQTPQYSDFTQMSNTILNGGAALGALTAQVCGHDDPHTPENARALGRHLHFAEQLQALGRELRRGRLTVPREDLERFGLTPHELRAPVRSKKLDEFVRFETGRAEQWLSESLGALPPADAARLLPLRIHAAIECATLREVARDGARMLHRGVALTPLRKLWIAWRSARRNS